jgi:hypothetical protein
VSEAEIYRRRSVDRVESGSGEGRAVGRPGDRSMLSRDIEKLT